MFARRVCGAERRRAERQGLLTSGQTRHVRHCLGLRAIVGIAHASGERLQEGALTAAHPSLPFGTMVAVSNKRNGRTVTVRINDRGPFVRGRVIDLTPAAAHALSFSGTTEVSLAVVGGK